MLFTQPADSRNGVAPILSVTALNQAVARMLERSFPLTWVSGEISNFTKAASGHWYFTLKDEGAQVRSVMFKGRAQHAGFIPREGDKVEVRALVTLYAPRGDYQLNVEAIRRAGAGNLYEAFLRLKEKLNAEGLFDPDRKRPIPPFVRCIGVVTSLQAAALRDILTTLARRAPHVRVVIYPTPVQGEGAAEKIARAIQTASGRNECDVLLVCRGGGSIEDLWSFNDEGVARAIIAAAMPVISGVGHETDVTISDFTADLRAATPTAAAELAAIPRDDWLSFLNSHAADMTRAMRRQLAETSQTLDWLTRRLVSPATTIHHERLKLQNLQTRLMHATTIPLRQSRYTLLHLHTRLSAQLPDTRRAKVSLLEQARRCNNALIYQHKQNRVALGALHAQLELLNPQRTLERGYAIVTNAKGTVLRAPKDLMPRQIVTIQLAQGIAQIGIDSVQPTFE